MKSKYNTKKGAFSAKTGMDVAFAAIFVLGIAFTVTQDQVDNLTTSGVNGSPTVTGTASTVVGYAPLIVAAGFLYVVARISGIL